MYLRVVFWVLFCLRFINDIDKAVECVTIIKKLADDTKVGHIVMNPTDSETLQTSLNNLSGCGRSMGDEI